MGIKIAENVSSRDDGKRMGENDLGPELQEERIGGT